MATIGPIYLILLAIAALGVVVSAYVFVKVPGFPAFKRKLTKKEKRLLLAGQAIAWASIILAEILFKAGV